MKTRIVYTKIWEDEYFFSLDDKEQLAFLFLLTNDKINLIGIYELNDMNLVMWLRTTNDKIQQIKTKFQSSGKFAFYRGWVKVINYDKYNSFGGNLNQVAKEREYKAVPQEVLEYFNTLSIPLAYPIDTVSIPQVISNKKSVINNKKSVEELEAEEIVNLYNECFGGRKTAIDPWLGNFKYWRRSYSLDEIKEAIVKWNSGGWLWEFKSGKPDLGTFFRTENKAGKCDYIGQFLNRSSNSFTRSLSEDEYINAMGEIRKKNGL